MFIPLFCLMIDDVLECNRKEQLPRSDA